MAGDLGVPGVEGVLVEAHRDELGEPEGHWSHGGGEGLALGRGVRLDRVDELGVSDQGIVVLRGGSAHHVSLYYDL